MKILIVDDEPALRDFLVESVQLQGYEAVTAGDGREGLDVFTTQSPDLVLTDICMPRMDGLDFLSAIREQDSEVIVIMVTGLGSEEVALEALRRNANDFLRKPIHHQVLFPLLEKYAGIIATRSNLRSTLGLFLSRSYVMQFDNHLEGVPHIAQRIMLETANAIPVEQRLGTRIGLVELIANAIEHGNLGITYEEKQAAMNDGFDGLQDLLAKRLQDPVRAARRVTVEACQTHEACHWTISDEGAGFDWKALPDPLDPRNLEQPNGRGIFLAKLHFDQVEFLGRGNQVRVTKLLLPGPAGSSKVPSETM
jgi:CheY-like chemotaxis protein